MVRPPDLEGKLEPTSPLLAWTQAPRAVAEALGRLTGSAEVEGLAQEAADVSERELVEGLELAVRVWRVDAPATEPYHAANIATWIVNGPFHPFWKWWMLGVIHLREIEGVAPPHKQYDEAEYELLIVALNPERGEPDIDAIERGDDWGDESKAKFMSPPEVAFQWHGTTDDQAFYIGELAARAIAAGNLSPDEDFRQVWLQTLANTVRHIVAGGH